MGVQWTKEQQEVIRLRDRNILVSAAAGSGKTAVLVIPQIIRCSSLLSSNHFSYPIITVQTENLPDSVKLTLECV